MIKALSLDNYLDFSCIGGDCPETCCANWSIIIDEQTYNYYNSVEGDFGKLLADNIHDIDNKHFFINDSNGRCPFLNDKDLCDIYINLGPENMCVTCKQYPRSNYLVGDIAFNYVCLSCPEVARMMLSRTDRIEFNISDVDYDPKLPDDYDWNRFNTIVNALTTSMDIIQNRDYIISDRLRLFILFNNMLNDNMAGANEIIDFFSNSDNFQVALSSVSNINSNITSKIKIINRMIKETLLFKRDVRSLVLIKGFEDFITNKDSDESLIKVAFAHIDNPEYAIIYEQLLVNFIFMQYAKTFDKTDAINAAFNVFLLFLFHNYIASLNVLITNKLSADDFSLITRSIFRQVEHRNNEQGFKSFTNNLISEGFASLGKMLELL